MDRTRVYKVIDSEREYQEQKWGTQEKDLLSYITILEDYINKAREAWYKGDTQAMDVIRKLGALCVACAEEHGIRPRKTYDNPVKITVNRIPWKRVDSTSISHIRYSPRTQELGIRFRHGGEYVYSMVAPNVYTMFENARSKGQFYHRNIKGIYPIKEIL